MSLGLVADYSSEEDVGSDDDDVYELERKAAERQMEELEREEGNLASDAGVGVAMEAARDTSDFDESNVGRDVEKYEPNIVYSLATTGTSAPSHHGADLIQIAREIGPLEPPMEPVSSEVEEWRAQKMDLDEDDFEEEEDDFEEDEEEKAVVEKVVEEDAEELSTKKDVLKGPRPWNVAHDPLPMPRVNVDHAVRPLGEIISLSVEDGVVVVQGQGDEKVPLVHGRSGVELAPGHAVFDVGSVFCVEVDGERRVLGVVQELWGPVKQPLYTVSLPKEPSVDSSTSVPNVSPQDIHAGQLVFSVTPLSNLVPTGSTFKKGYDIQSDEEQDAPAEAQYSDDEEQRKAMRQNRRKKVGRRRKPPTTTKPPSSQPPPLTSPEHWASNPQAAAAAAEYFRKAYEAASAAASQHKE